MSPGQPQDGDVLVPLWSDEAEAAFLGALMLSSRPEELVETLQPEDFHRPAHRTIFEAAAGLVAKGRPVGSPSLRQALADVGRLEWVGGLDALTGLEGNAPPVVTAPGYASVVREKGVRRRTLDALGQAERAARTGEDLDALRERLRAIPAVVDSGGGEDAHVDLRRLLLDEESWGQSAVVSSGNRYVDALCEGGGLECGQFSLWTAPPGEGKSTSALGVVFAALERGERCAWLSFTDLSRKHLVRKAIRYLTGINGSAHARSDADRRAIADAKEHVFTSWDWEIYDTQSSRGARYFETAAAWLRRQQAEGLARRGEGRFPAQPLRLVGWDYAQMVFSNAERFRSGRTTFYEQQKHVAQEFRLLTAEMATAHALMCAQLTIDGKDEKIRDCPEWDHGCEFWFRVQPSGLKIRKRRFGGKTDKEPPHDHHPRRQTFVSEGMAWDPRFDPFDPRYASAPSAGTGA